MNLTKECDGRDAVPATVWPMWTPGGTGRRIMRMARGSDGWPVASGSAIGTDCVRPDPAAPESCLTAWMQRALCDAVLAEDSPHDPARARARARIRADA